MGSCARVLAVADGDAGRQRGEGGQRGFTPVAPYLQALRRALSPQGASTSPLVPLA